MLTEYFISCIGLQIGQSPPFWWEAWPYRRQVFGLISVARYFPSNLELQFMKVAGRQKLIGCSWVLESIFGTPSATKRRGAFILLSLVSLSPVCSVYRADAGGHQLSACFASSALKYSAWFEIYEVAVSFPWRLSYSPALGLNRKNPQPLLADQKE